MSSAGASNDESYEPRFDAGGMPRGGLLPPSFPDHVRDRLEREIIELRLAPGERVTEDKLAGRMRLSRTPIREAMRLLEARGLIVRSRGRGTYVAERITPAEASALYDLRAPIESHLAARSAELRTDEDLADMDALQAQFAVTVEQPDSPTRFDRLVGLDSDLHWTIYRAAQSDLASIVASYWGRLQRELYDRVYRRGDARRFAVEHRRIVDAIRAQDAEAARVAMREHVESGWEAVKAAFGAAAAAAESA
ncbi:MAG TPA: GntR family transcriptional regulator [Conexibacter sp.]|nr:GntR family transcriptional regulator [Conexibacter sp.]